MFRSLAILLLLLPWLLVATPAVAQTSSSCAFVLGFQTLHDLIPQQVGDCQDNEGHAGPGGTPGDALQHTTGGLLVWRKADNWTAFTDGYHTWINGPYGLQERLNSQRFAWEANQDHLPVVAVVQTATIGYSVQGRPITETQLGGGSQAVAFVGDTHGGPEAVTDTLITTALAYFEAHPAELPASVTAYFIPTLNPDGLADGSRLNADGVDLNRNFGTDDWSPNAFEPSGFLRGVGGPQPFSEPESRVMRDFLLSHHVAASIFYHSPWGGLFAEPHSIPFAQSLAQASGYPYHLPGQDTPYPMTGTAHRWADEHGEASVLLELHGGDGIEWAANYQAMLAAMRYVAL